VTSLDRPLSPVNADRNPLCRTSIPLPQIAVGKNKPLVLADIGFFGLETRVGKSVRLVALIEGPGHVRNDAREITIIPFSHFRLASADCDEVKPELVGACDFRGPDPAQRPLNGASLASGDAAVASSDACGFHRCVSERPILPENPQISLARHQGQRAAGCVNWGGKCSVENLRTEDSGRSYNEV
jgi:hypothetical protein